MHVFPNLVTICIKKPKIFTGKEKGNPVYIKVYMLLKVFVIPVYSLFYSLPMYYRGCVLGWFSV